MDYLNDINVHTLHANAIYQIKRTPVDSHVLGKDHKIICGICFSATDDMVSTDGSDIVGKMVVSKNLDLDNPTWSKLASISDIKQPIYRHVVYDYQYIYNYAYSHKSYVDIARVYIECPTHYTYYYEGVADIKTDIIYDRMKVDCPTSYTYDPYIPVDVPINITNDTTHIGIPINYWYYYTYDYSLPCGDFLNHFDTTTTEIFVNIDCGAFDDFF